jgi:hypothetical protein
MPVLVWANHHRLLVGAVGLTVTMLALVAVGWVLWHQSSTTPVSVGQAKRSFRSQQRPGRLPPGLPVPGVYRYRTTGGERLSVGSVRRAFPAVTDVVVVDGKCASFDWVPLEEHTEELTECRTPGGATTPSSTSTEHIASLSTSEPISCGSGAYLLPSDPAPRANWSASCSSGDTRIALTGSVVGPATVTVAGRVVAAEHVRVELTFTGSEHGTNPCDYWIAPADGLVLREVERVDLSESVGPFGTVHYSEYMSISLASTTPLH